jgi:hypothetical protein
LLNPDFRELLSALSDEKSEYLVVGAYALALHGLPRATGDLDVWIRASLENGQCVYRALARFGAPLTDVTPQDFATPGRVFQIGVAPLRIDILTSLDGVTFDEAWEARETSKAGGVELPFLSRQHLVRNKRATGRPQDLADAARLEELPGSGPG